MIWENIERKTAFQEISSPFLRMLSKFRLNLERVMSDGEFSRDAKELIQNHRQSMIWQFPNLIRVTAEQALSRERQKLTRKR